MAVTNAVSVFFNSYHSDYKRRHCHEHHQHEHQHEHEHEHLRPSPAYPSPDYHRAARLLFGSLHLDPSISSLQGTQDIPLHVE